MEKKSNNHIADSQNDKSDNSNLISRREALKYMLTGSVGLAGLCLGMNVFKGKGASSGWLSEGLKLPQAFAAATGQAKVDRRTDTKNPADVSLLGFGCMRFPTIEGGKVDENAVQLLVDYAMSHGVNYFDTAWVYHNGLSENIIGRALKKYPRESFFLADKMPTWNVRNLESAKTIFQEQLDKCGVEYFDFFLLHAISDWGGYKRAYLDTGALDYLIEEKKAGRIRRLGFSTHGDAEFLEKMLEQPFDWDFVQIQLNYYDWDSDDVQSGKLYKLLADKGIQCIVMEPLKGGMLASLNDGVSGMLKQAQPNRSVASWAFRFAASLPNVLTVLSGMTYMEHLVDNVNTMTAFQPLDDNERRVLGDALRAFMENQPMPCTGCRYCMPCPYGIDIPGVFAVYNERVSKLSVPNVEGEHDGEYNRKRRAFLNLYNDSLAPETRADRCIACGKCMTMCPQHIRIPDKMLEIENLVNQLRKG